MNPSTPLLRDRNLNPKPAFFSVLETARGRGTIGVFPESQPVRHALGLVKMHGSFMNVQDIRLLLRSFRPTHRHL